MITPEPTTAVELVGWDQLELPVPAAGHLGVIEERCTDALHEKTAEDGHPCPTCRAVL